MPSKVFSVVDVMRAWSGYTNTKLHRVDFVTLKSGAVGALNKMVFEDTTTQKYYEICYFHDGSDFQWTKDGTVECAEVKPVEVTTIEYRKVK